MPKLSCGVFNCAYNDSNLCSLNSIKVSGGETKSNTCCSSFAESNGVTNCVSGFASPDTDIHCEAHDCIHNENCACHADNVDVSSLGSANNCIDTKCNSFTQK
ncbi:protein of unknown function [Hathewaya proteolytica DSM 3090]|uniref:DUF1540 domain-containing protein n=1 Tax=Hathewaya proteolytica DSM 3090 TaxID=1121331 RepID=A0A1M6KJK5_9CLOT|nr:DUF1540 domain-containing protein [Hathewaya proteolytica]SHJ59148.1 protein of unknown function [Hathewaya proteolytica DSM 3090]